MGSFLRSIVASPRVRNDDKGTGTSLDMAYITDTIIVMSLPAPSFPETAYRNPLPQVLTFLDTYHSGKWRIFEFRGEGAGYRDAAFRNQVEHYPWSDHHPPPFELVPLIVDSMQQHITAAKGNVTVLHCKAGKGRTGSMSCAYLIVHQGWTANDAMKHFTAKRMRMGEGISIPSQQRWLRYVERWALDKRAYSDFQLEILEMQVVGLREHVCLRIVEHDGDSKNRKLVIRHTFTPSEEQADGASVRYTPSKALFTGCNVNVDVGIQHRIC